MDYFEEHPFSFCQNFPYVFPIFPYLSNNSFWKHRETFIGKWERIEKKTEKRGNLVENVFLRIVPAFKVIVVMDNR